MRNLLLTKFVKPVKREAVNCMTCIAKSKFNPVAEHGQIKSNWYQTGILATTRW